MLTFHSFRALGLTLSRLHYLLPKSFNADAISSLQILKSIREGNLYFGPRDKVESCSDVNVVSRIVSLVYFQRPDDIFEMNLVLGINEKDSVKYLNNWK